jgi:hypothetical protein
MFVRLEQSQFEQKSIFFAVSDISSAGYFNKHKKQDNKWQTVVKICQLSTLSEKENEDINCNKRFFSYSGFNEKNQRYNILTNIFIILLHKQFCNSVCWEK